MSAPNEARRGFPLEQLVVRLPKNKEKWHLKSNPKKVALVMWCRKEDDPEWPTLLRGYVMLKAPWYRRGIGGKSLDTFVEQFEPHNAEANRQASTTENCDE